ncbi:PREDICTED: centrosomal protein of 162 kDa-like isoform X6 [Cyprinodon variegatus]|uniref:centrosomal protein of 162 kDa-like isoform X6 n=1 Tax=Cyprinodon variegatus TaxID=28743 RepID=UPI000742CA01|nr:PREDICTED: centrosomal protein of 162 kDa-like isoform X6 [Cyprinodon variegatus]
MQSFGPERRWRFRRRLTMSHRRSEEELDADFEKFLKESVSDDSVDLSSPDRQSKPSRQKPPWWSDDEHSGGAAESSQRRFIKDPKPPTNNNQAVHLDPPQKPVPRPRSTALHTRPKQTASADPQSLEGGGAWSGGQSRPTDEDLQRRSPDAAANSDGGIHGLTGSGKVFRKSLRGSQPTEEEGEDAGGPGQRAVTGGSEREQSVLAAAGRLSRMGLDTLEEEEEKARFFAQIEAGASSAVYYSQLNREMDSSLSTFTMDLRKVEKEEMEQREAGAAAPAISPHYSEDFEDEEGLKEPLGQKASQILARVSLYDSLDDTCGEDRGTDGGKDGGKDGGQLYTQSGGSEVEALQEAYRQIHSVDDSDQHLGDRGGAEGPAPPPSPPQQSLQPASTKDSDLPTAEELMKPIRPENHRAQSFNLQAARAAELHPDLKKTFLVQTPSKEPRKSAPTAGLKGAARSSIHSRSRSPEPPHPKLAFREGEQRQKKSSSQSLPEAGNTRNQRTSRSSSMVPERKTAAGVKAGGGRAAGRSRAAPSKPPSDGGAAEAGLEASGELVASVQSLLAVLQQQIHTGSHEAAQQVRAPLQAAAVQDSSGAEALRVQLAQKEEELQRMKDEVQEMNLLRQQNYLLQSKLRLAEEASQKRKRVEPADLSSQEKCQKIEKEIQEQETLLRGYQQENEKLYLQMKAQQAQSKANQEAMFTENQRLLNELAHTREQLRNTWRPVDQTKQISELQAEIRLLQKKQAELSEEKRSLEVELQLLRKERDEGRAGEKLSEAEEVAALKKKLQWFAENQELLDRDARRLKEATAEILRLRDQVEKLKQETGQGSRKQQRKIRDGSADTRKMQELQRQVKELEQILRSRNPNSLPALIYAAATEDGASAGTPPPSRVNALLERRVQRLESELESHDEEAKRSLRAMEQQFHRIRLRYEQQISELEQQLLQTRPTEAAAPAAELWTSRCQLLEEELRREKISHQEKEESLQEQIEALQQQLRPKVQSSPGRHQRQAEAAFGARIERLNRELATKNRRIQELNRTVERLKGERRGAPSAPRRSAESGPCAGPTGPQQHAAGTNMEEETFPAAQNEKTYQPTAFTGSHISEVLQENEALRERVEQLQLQSEKDQEELQARAARAEEELSRLRERSAEQLSSMKAEHLRVLDRLRAAHALEHSSSKVAELSNKLQTQEVAMKHLQQQLKELQESKEALCISRRREEALQKQLTQLLQELKEAKEAQSSEVKLLCSLERKIINMELRQEHREKELQQVVADTFHMSAADLQSEVERWRRLAQDRSRELDAFRSELDSILDILRHLQKQGGVLPPLR